MTPFNKACGFAELYEDSHRSDALSRYHALATMGWDMDAVIVTLIYLASKPPLTISTHKAQVLVY